MNLITQDGRQFNTAELHHVDIDDDNCVIAKTSDGQTVILGKYETFKEAEYTMFCLKACYQLLRPHFIFKECGYTREYEFKGDDVG